MTEREKIISLARGCGLNTLVIEMFVNNFYHAAQREAYEKAAQVCEARDPRPDQWSENSEYTESRVVNECAAEIRQLKEQS